MNIDLYEVLGISRDSNQDTIKSAYRKLAVRYHPDKNPDDREAEEKFKEISRAYEVLYDPEKRAAYDRYGTVDGIPDPSDIFSGGFGLDDALRAFMESFGFGSVFGGAASGRGSRVGGDISVSVSLSLEEAALGTRQELEVRRKEPCSRCNGSGADPDAGVKTCLECGGQGRIRRTRRTILGSMSSIEVCAICGGSGKIPEKFCKICRGKGVVSVKRKIKVEIPAGVSEGHYLRLRRQGNTPEGGGIQGDLIVEIGRIDYGSFSRESSDLIYEIDVSFPQAVLGDSIEVPDITGSMRKIDLPAGMQPGEIILLRNEGMQRLNGRSRGNLKIVVNVRVPRKISKEEKHLLHKLAGSKNF